MPNRQSSIVNSKSSATGTREWSDYSLNIQTGCEHGCRYCYARYDAVCRYKRCTAFEWGLCTINQKKVDRSYGRFDGVVMYPTCHDITPRNLSEYMIVLRKLLDAGNQVLITSKPHFNCITLICETFKEFRRQITFRFTIGSVVDEALQFWEPHATNISERISCLQYAFEAGYVTSVSCEPFLDAWPQHVYEATVPWLTDSFWLGLMNKKEQRVDLADVPAELIASFVMPLKKAQSPAMLKEYHRIFAGKPYVKFKKEFRDMIGI